MVNPIFARPRTVELSFGKVRRSFTYPEAANMAEQLQAILKGLTYPLPPLPGFAPRLVLDIGANVGATAVYFAFAYPGAQIRCYEPSARNVAFLAQNVAGLANVRVLPIGLGAEDGERRLFLGRHQSMESSLHPSAGTTDEHETARIERAAAALGDLDSGPGVVMKLDTEGEEVPILADVAPLLGNVDVLYVEYHSDEDRRAIETLVEAHMVLSHARSDLPHLGQNRYLARRLGERYPEMNVARIARRPATRGFNAS